MSWYLTITKEMRTAGLSGNALLVFALVNGYSQEKQGCYYGSLAHTAEVVGCTAETARTTLKSLVEKGFVEKFEFIDNGVKRVAYRATQKIWDAQKIEDDLPKNLDTPSQKIWDNNNSKYRNDKKKDNNIFDFRSELIRIGVTAETADAWMEIRRKKRASNSKIAFKEICTELGKVDGLTPDDCIRKAVARNWCGFEAAWIQPVRVNRYQPRKQESVFEYNARQAEEAKRNIMKYYNTNPDEQ